MLLRQSLLIKTLYFYELPKLLKVRFSLPLATHYWHVYLKFLKIGPRINTNFPCENLLKEALSRHVYFFPVKTTQKSFFLTSTVAVNITLKFRTKKSTNFFARRVIIEMKTYFSILKWGKMVLQSSLKCTEILLLAF